MPVVDRIEHEYAGKLRVVRVDVNDPASRALMNQYRFPGTPYLVFANAAGEVVLRRGGARSVETIRTELEAVVAKLINID